MSTIFALSSAPGRAAVSVIRVSGPQAHVALAAMTRTVPAPRQATLRRIFHPYSRIELDQALVLRFDAPHSETGEDMVEFQVHGGRAVVAAVLQALGQVSGCRLAEPGEFARRGFDNGKLDLTTAEGIADLVDAETEAQRRQAVQQSGGALATLYDEWRSRLIEAQGYIEAAIDFSDEGDVGSQAFESGRTIADTLAGALREHLAGAHRGEILRDGFKVVIAGPPNAGKSSLLNALARRDVAIVSAEAGTTRDVIEVRLDLGGYPVVVSDTAGLRDHDTVGAIEREGMRRTLEHSRQADMVVWLTDTIGEEAPPPSLPDHSVRLWVRNKADLLPTDGLSDAPEAGAAGANVSGHALPLLISVRTGQGLSELIERIATAASEGAGNGSELGPTNQRQVFHLRRAEAHLATFLTGDADQAELRAEDLRRAAVELGRITGRIDAEDVLDQVFSRFCIGK